MVAGFFGSCESCDGGDIIDDWAIDDDDSGCFWEKIGEGVANNQ